MKKQASGFTLIELLVVLAIIGIIAAIAVMNYLSALTRARQKATMADIRSIAVAWEARAVDLKRYNAAGAFSVPAASIAEVDLTSALSPTYIRQLPQHDAWGTPFAFNSDQPYGGTMAGDEYCIRSAGRDAKFQGMTYTPGPTENPDDDIVYSSGNFVVSPAFPK